MNGTPNSKTAISLAAKIRANVVGLRHTTASVRDGAAYNRYIDNLLDTADTLDPPKSSAAHQKPAHQTNEAPDAPSEEAKAKVSVLDMAHRFGRPARRNSASVEASNLDKPQGELSADNLRLYSVRRLDESGIDRCLADPPLSDPSFGE